MYNFADSGGYLAGSLAASSRLGKTAMRSAPAILDKMAFSPGEKIRGGAQLVKTMASAKSNQIRSALTKSKSQPVTNEPAESTQNITSNQVSEKHSTPPSMQYKEIRAFQNYKAMTESGMEKSSEIDKYMTQRVTAPPTPSSPQHKT